MAKKATKTKATRARKGATAETIVTAVNARTGNGLVVTTSNDRNIVVTKVDGEVNKLARPGEPVAALEAYLKDRPQPVGRLARGVDGQNSPHSAKAVRDNRRNAKGAKAAKGRSDAAAVAGKAPKAKKANGMRGLAANPQKMTTVVKARDSGLASGSGRMAKLEFAAKCKTTADFLGKVVKDAAGKEHKCDAGALSGMVKRGHVRLG